MAATYHQSSADLKIILIDKMSELPPAAFDEKELELILTVCRVASGMSDFAVKTVDLLWRIIVQTEDYKSSLSEKALNRFTELLRSQDRAALAGWAGKCL